MRATSLRAGCAVLLVVGALGLVPSAATSAQATGTTVAGGNGAGAGATQFHYPSGIVVDAARSVYVADIENHRVQHFSRGATKGVTVAGGKGQGNAAHQLAFPGRIALDTAGNLYIADGGNARVQRWAPGAAAGTTVAGGNGIGSAANQFNGLGGVALDRAGNLYVADGNNHRVQRWKPGATTGVTVAGGNGGGSGANQLQWPADVALDAAGRLYIADRGNARVQRWTPGGTSGVTVAGGNGVGSNANQLNIQVWGISVADDGTVDVADFFNNRVQRWAPGATSGVTVAGGNGYGSSPDQLAIAAGVASDAAGNIYVTDSDNHRVQRWPAVRPNPLPAAGFTDVPGGLYYSTAVDWAAWTKVTTGYGGTNRFAPDVDVTRGQMVTFLWRTLDSPGGHPAHGFNDVPPSTFYEHALRWARATGITTGYGGTNSFAPEVAVTRGQMVTFLWRLAGQPAGHPAHGFTDVPPGTFYENALRWARATGVTTGIGGTNSFAPDDPVTRAQMVTFLRRLASTDAAWRVGTTIPSTVLF